MNIMSCIKKGFIIYNLFKIYNILFKYLESHMRKLHPKKNTVKNSAYKSI